MLMMIVCCLVSWPKCLLKESESKTWYSLLCPCLGSKLCKEIQRQLLWIGATQWNVFSEIQMGTVQLPKECCCNCSHWQGCCWLHRAWGERATNQRSGSNSESLPSKNLDASIQGSLENVKFQVVGPVLLLDSVDTVLLYWLFLLASATICCCCWPLTPHSR